MSILCTYTPSLSFSPPPLAPIIFFLSPLTGVC